MSDERTITYSRALNEALQLEMRRDPRVFCLGEDIAIWGDGGGVFGVTSGLVDEFGPERVRDTPISENGFVSMAVGAAIVGSRPVVEIMYSDFLTLAMDPIVNQAAKMRYMFGGQASVPMVLRTNLGASGGKAAQHSQSFETWFLHVPGLKVVMPGTPADAKGLLLSAIRDDNPVLFFEHKLLYFSKGPVPEEMDPIPFGQAAVRREGTDATVVAFQHMALQSLKAADELAREGIKIEVIDPRTLFPFDIETIVESVKRTNRLVIVHEAVERAGWAGEVAMQVSEQAFDWLDAPIERVCTRNVPIAYAKPMEDHVLPTSSDVVAAVKRSLQGAKVTK